MIQRTRIIDSTPDYCSNPFPKSDAKIRFALVEYIREKRYVQYLLMVNTCDFRWLPALQSLFSLTLGVECYRVMFVLRKFWNVSHLLINISFVSPSKIYCFSKVRSYSRLCFVVRQSLRISNSTWCKLIAE